MQQWLIKARLELVGDNQDAILGHLECLGYRNIALQVVHRGLGVLTAGFRVFNGSRECNERPVRQVHFLHDAIKLTLVAHSMQA